MRRQVDWPERDRRARCRGKSRRPRSPVRHGSSEKRARSTSCSQSAGKGEAVPLGEITEQHFDAAFNLNTRGTLFTVQKALPLFNDGGSIIMTGSNASVKGFPVGRGMRRASWALRSFARTWLNELKGRNIRVNVLVPGAIAHRCRKKFSPRRRRRCSNP